MSLRIEVVYALPDRCWRLTLQLAEGATVASALQAADLAVTLPDAVVDPAKLAIYGRAAKLEDALHDGDRIEILRDLVMDPKQARRQRAARAGKAT